MRPASLPRCSTARDLLRASKAARAATPAVSHTAPRSQTSFASYAAAAAAAASSGGFFSSILRRAAPGSKPPSYPTGRATISEHHGDAVVDEHGWMSRTDGSAAYEREIDALIKAENGFATSFLRSHAAFAARLDREMTSRWEAVQEAHEQGGDGAAPGAPLSATSVISRGYVYTTTPLQDGYVCETRRKILSEAGGELELGPEELVLDQARLAETYGQAPSAVSQMKVSPNNKHVSFLIALEGRTENTELFILDMSSQRVIDRVDDCSSMEWLVVPEGKGAAQRRTLDQLAYLHTTRDANARPSKIYLRELSASPESGTWNLQRSRVILEEPDDRFFLDLSRTKNGEFVTLNSNSKVSSEVRVLRPDAFEAAPGGGSKLIHPRDQFSYFVEHSGERFYIFTNADGATNYKVVSAPVHAPEKNSWADVIPVSESRKIEDAEVFEGKAVIYGRDLNSGLPLLSVACFSQSDGTAGACEHILELPESERVCALQHYPNPDSSTTKVRFSTSSPILPHSDWQLHLDTARLEHVGSQGVGGTPLFVQSEYVCQRKFVPSAGAQVPVTLVHKKGLQMDGSSPTLAMVYGSYGENLDIGFAIPHTCLLQRGWVLAFCHVRGGGELGSTWHAAAGPGKKAASVDDYEACLRYLMASRYSSESRLCGQGTSAGGLVVAALCNRRPELLAAAVLQVPFLDLLGAMCDPSLPLTVHERDEWGDPLADPRIFASLKSVCPYTNLGSAHKYPPMFVSAARHDGRVPFWQPLKYVARLRGLAGKKQHTPTAVLRTNLEGDHYHATFRDIAEQYAFLYKALGLPPS